MTTDGAPGGRRDGWLVAAAAIAGHVGVGLARHPSARFDKYPTNAALLAAGKGVFPSDGSPLYLWLHLLAGGRCREVVHGLQIAVGIAAVLGAWRLGVRLGGRAAGLIAGVVLALSAPTVFYEAVLEPDSLIASLGLLALAAAAARRPATSGVLVGLAAALRPTALPLALLLGGWQLVSLRARRDALVLVGLAVAVALLPAAALRLRFGGSMAATMSTGQILHQGNAPETLGFPSFVPLTKSLERQPAIAAMADAQHETYRMVARAAAGPRLSEAECERYWIARAAAFVARHPVAWLRIVYYKSALLFGPIEFPDMGPAIAELGRAPAPLLPSWLLYPLGGIALLLTAALRPSARLVALAALALAAPLVLFAVDARYRIVLLPPAAVAIGVAGSALAAAVRARDRGAAGRVAIALHVAVPLTVPPPAHRASARVLRKQVQSSPSYAIAVALRARGEMADATRAMQASLTLQPNGARFLDLGGFDWESPAFWAPIRERYERRLAHAPTPGIELDAGVIDEQAGLLDEAIAHFQRAADAGYYAQDEESGEPLHRAGRLLLRLRRFADAARAFDAALARRPGVMVILADAEVAAREAGDTARAGALRDELDHLHDPISSALERSRALRWSGEAAAARRELGPVLVALPNAADAWAEEALAAVDDGDPARAVEAYARAVELAPDTAFPVATLDAAMPSRGAPLPAGLAAEHAYRRARLADAAWLYDRALAEHPSLAERRAWMSHRAIARLAAAR